MQFVVVGGTGLIGSRVVAALRTFGNEAEAASPSVGVDTFTGVGLREALDGSQVVIDASNSRSLHDESVLAFFSTSTRNLLDAEAAAGVAHHIALSVVGTDRLQESGYFRAKLHQEALVEESSVPFSIVRATQFFEFVGTIADVATDDTAVRLPPVLCQPIAADDVAEVIADVSRGSPINGTVEIAGPERFRLDHLVHKRLAARNDPRQVLADPTAPYFGAHVGETTLLPSDSARLGSTRFEAWLHVGDVAASRVGEVGPAQDPPSA